MNDLIDLLRENYGIALSFMFDGEAIMFTVTNDIITIEGELPLNVINNDQSVFYDTIKTAVDSVNNMTTDEMYQAYDDMIDDRENNNFAGPGMN